MDRSRSRRREAARGFTLLEVIIAVTIVAILATLIVPRLTRYIGQAKDRRARADAATLAQQVELYMTTFGISRLPDDFALDVLADGDDPLLKNREQLKDPWGRPFEIRIPGVINRDFDIRSAGDDGQFETADDVVNGQA
ncbi:MAG: type II secretion system protein GspG [Phycisphaerales bacterium]